MDFFHPHSSYEDKTTGVSQNMDCSALTSDEQGALMQMLVDALATNQELLSYVSDQDSLFMDGISSNFDQCQFFGAEASMVVSNEPSYACLPFTTVMVRNIPRKCSQRMLMADIISTGFGNAVDFVYLPTDISSGKNLGYAFINFIIPDGAVSFREYFHKKHLSTMRGSRAGISVSYAVIQGLDANIENVMKNASVHRIRNPEYLPLVLSRSEGRLIPYVVGKRRNSQSSASSSPQFGATERAFFAQVNTGSFLKAH